MMQDTIEMALAEVMNECFVHTAETDKIVEQVYLGLVYDVIFKHVVPESERQMEDEVYLQFENEVSHLLGIMINSQVVIVLKEALQEVKQKQSAERCLEYAIKGLVQDFVSDWLIEAHLVNDYCEHFILEQISKNIEEFAGEE